MDKTDNTIRAIPPLVSSRVAGCLGVVEKAVFDAKRPAEMDESEIFVFGHVGDGGAQSTEVEGSDDTGGASDDCVGYWRSCH
eukprot:scaffold86351_cov69-Cyclotella_meneghiniana.AAC.1